MGFLQRFVRVVLMVPIMIVHYSCERPTAPPNPNLPPNTTAANIPKDNDTLFALVTLHWDGEDDDGFIAKYQYRYVTQHLFTGDSSVEDWKETTETSLTIAFNSSDPYNYQKFQVRAVDNIGDADPTPAEKYFYTRQTIFPETEIISPGDNQDYFAIEQTTDWWEGIELTFTARDEDGEVVEYAWAVDGSDWTWIPDTTLFITPDRFRPPLEGSHGIRVISRDNTNLIDPVGDSVTVRLVKPSFTEKILIIDASQESIFPFGVQVSDAEVDNFYAEVFSTTNSWDYTAQRGIPSRAVLGQYRLIIWHSDHRPASQPHVLPQHTEVLKDYLNVGGKFIMSGWRILKSFAWDENFPVSFARGSFVHDYLHIVQADETPLDGDFTGAIGVGPYSDIAVDSLKLLDAFPFFGKLAQVNIIPQRAGFTEIIYSYKNRDDSQYSQYRGRACGLRYYGTSFDAVVLGFPVFFINKQHAITLASEILASLGIN